MGIFIEVQVENDKIDNAGEIVLLCPVSIFAEADGQLTVIPENEDECTLCELCLDAAPPGAIRIKKLYKDETLVSRGKAQHE